MSTRRLEQFLRQPEVRKEFEGIRKIARVMSRSEASLDVFEIDDDGDTAQTMTDYPNSPDHLSDETFNIGFETNTNMDYFNQDPVSNDNGSRSEYGKRRTGNSSIKLKKNNQISIRTKSDRNRQRQKSLSSKEIQPELPNDLVVSLRNAVFSWDSEGLNACMRIDQLDIPRGEDFFSVIATAMHDIDFVGRDYVYYKIILSNNPSSLQFYVKMGMSLCTDWVGIVDGLNACIQIRIWSIPWNHE